MSGKEEATRAAHRLSKVLVNVLQDFPQIFGPSEHEELFRVACDYEEAYKRYLEEAS